MLLRSAPMGKGPPKKLSPGAERARIERKKREREKARLRRERRQRGEAFEAIRDDPRVKPTDAMMAFEGRVQKTLAKTPEELRPLMGAAIAVGMRVRAELLPTEDDVVTVPVDGEEVSLGDEELRASSDRVLAQSVFGTIGKLLGRARAKR
jgi:hypothetical protein